MQDFKVRFLNTCTWKKRRWAQIGDLLLWNTQEQSIRLQSVVVGWDCAIKNWARIIEFIYFFFLKYFKFEVCLFGHVGNYKMYMFCSINYSIQLFGRLKSMVCYVQERCIVHFFFKVLNYFIILSFSKMMW
jgi:hypothetical protein